jgi:predicted S18 family serine protease
MFLFFDFFAKALNSDAARPLDLAEERREASIVSRRVLKRRVRQQEQQAKRQY